MHTNRLDQIVHRQRARSLRDRAIAVGIVVVMTLGLGALNASARNLNFDQPDAASTTSVR